MNVEFPWNAAKMSEEAPVDRPAIKISPELMSKAISKMKSGKAAEHSGITTEMSKAAEDGVVLFE